MSQALNQPCPKCYGPLQLTNGVKYCPNGCDIYTAKPPERYEYDEVPYLAQHVDCRPKPLDFNED